MKGKAECPYTKHATARIDAGRDTRSWTSDITAKQALQLSPMQKAAAAALRILQKHHQDRPWEGFTATIKALHACRHVPSKGLLLMVP